MTKERAEGAEELRGGDWQVGLLFLAAWSRHQVPSTPRFSAPPGTLALTSLADQRLCLTAAPGKRLRGLVSALV